MEQQQIQQLFDISKLQLSLDMYSQNRDNPKATWALHYYYENGLIGVNFNLEKCIDCLKMAAKRKRPANPTF